MTRRITLRNFGGKLRRGSRDARRHVLRSVERVMNKRQGVAQRLIQDIAFDTGELARSLRVRSTPRYVMIFNTAPHAKWVEFGRPATGVIQTPYDVIRAWVKRKLDVPTEDLYRVTTLIRWKIAGRGIDPKPTITSDAFAKKTADECMEAAGDALLEFFSDL